MRLALLLLVGLTAVPALAENQLTDRDRQFLAQQQRVRDAQIQRARARCIELRGVDCDSVQGLQEWMMLDRTREEAVLDQVRPGPVFGAESVPSSGSGATTPASSR
jgi:hypothetical protein